MKRLQLPDLLKGFAVFLIVPVHILELFIDYPGRESLFGKTLLFLGGPVAVPVFMMIMGYFMARNKKPLKKNILRGVKVFAVGILLNIGLNFNLLLKIKYKGWLYNPWEYIFGVDILYLAGISIIVLSLLKIIQKGAPIIAVLLFFVFTGLTSTMNDLLMTTDRNYVLPFIAGTYSWSYFPVFPWLAYPMIGFAFYFMEERMIAFIRNQKLLTGTLLLMVAAIVIFFGKTGFSKTIYLPEYYHHTFLYSMWAIGVVTIWVALLWMVYPMFISLAPGKFFMWLGKNITLFYVIQWLIIGNIATAIYQTQSIGKYVFWFTGIFSVTVFLTWLIGKTNIKLAR